MDEPSPTLLVALMRSIAILAMEAEEQTAYVRNLGTHPSLDELALEFDDGFPLAPTFVEHGWLNHFAVLALQELNHQLATMSEERKAGLWHADALTTASEWARVRALARAAILAV
ncbi:hypothetical protein M1L60_10845 [Actinoplanes sp. TRM 88003]|uniref:Uncharacterized protein n=1 Tax=Paractinoplanes aksuensis TaxID=2939490 RepID=A0ABT1DM33_9ACTN|nr:hypothetical protein [Actinoplanes aksuensis]MCO8271090.1 hypothetical protein [Actinoplanes aksuensis]